jgi:hypothetical protein
MNKGYVILQSILHYENIWDGIIKSNIYTNRRKHVGIYVYPENIQVQLILMDKKWYYVLLIYNDCRGVSS